MRISTSNQTLILAGEQEGPRIAPGARVSSPDYLAASAEPASSTRMTVYTAPGNRPSAEKNVAQYVVTQRLRTALDYPRFIDEFA